MYQRLTNSYKTRFILPIGFILPRLIVENLNKLSLVWHTFNDCSTFATEWVPECFTSIIYEYTHEYWWWITTDFHIVLLKLYYNQLKTKTVANCTNLPEKPKKSATLHFVFVSCHDKFIFFVFFHHFFRFSCILVPFSTILYNYRPFFLFFVYFLVIKSNK